LRKAAVYYDDKVASHVPRTPVAKVTKGDPHGALPPPARDHLPRRTYPVISQLHNRIASQICPTPTMATDLIMPRLPDPQQQHHAAFFNAQPMMAAAPVSTPYQPPPPSAFTPQISPLSTSGNGSPTSPKSSITRPIRPMYMPAVLRPTEFPSKAPPLHIEGDADDGDERARFVRTNSSIISLPGLGAFRLSRRSTGDSGKCVDGDWNFDLFPKVSGPPTRKHWKVRLRWFTQPCDVSHTARRPSLVHREGGSLAHVPPPSIPSKYSATFRLLTP
jgi:hypothetical protein